MDVNELKKDRVRLVTSEGIEEVPEGFNLKGYLQMRAQRERDRRQELEEKYGEDFPLGSFNPIFVFAVIECLLNMKEQHLEAFDALEAKLRDPQFKIEPELREKIESHGTFLKKEGDNYKIDHLPRALFLEAEKQAEGGFAGFIGMRLTQRIKEREKK